MMKHFTYRSPLQFSALVIAFMLVLSTIPLSANALASSTSTTQSTEQQHLQNIITKGNAEITRRLTSLNAALSQVNSTTKLSTSDKASLVSEITQEIAGLTTLKSTLDAETTLAAAITDAKNIFNDYRVYALLLPKAWFIRVADSQITNEANLTTLATKLQSRLDAEKASGKDVTTLQTELTDLTTQVTNAQAISSSVETKVLPLQPSDYNTDHNILSGYATQLKTAHSDIQTAVTDAKNIVAGIKNLS